MSPIEYVVMQDYTRELLRTDKHEEAIKYLEDASKEYEDKFRVRLDKKSETLTFQDFNTGEIISTIRIKVYDNRVKDGGLFNGFNFANLLRA